MLFIRTSFQNVPMMKTPVFTAFGSFCTTYGTRMWKKQSCHKRPCLWRPRPNTGIFSVFAFLYKNKILGCGTGHIVTSVHAICDDAQNADLSGFASWHNILRKHVSQASMPLRPGPAHWYLQRFCHFVQHTKGSGSGLTQCTSETETQRKSKNKAAKNNTFGRMFFQE